MTSAFAMPFLASMRCPPDLLAALSSSPELPSALSAMLCALDRLEQARSGPGARYPACGAFLSYLDQDRRRVAFLARCGREGGELLTDEVPAPAFARTADVPHAQPVSIVTRLREDPFARAVLPALFPQTRSFLMVRLPFEFGDVGVLCLWSDRPDAFRAHHAQWAASMQVPVAQIAGLEVARRLNRLCSDLRRKCGQLSEQLTAEREAPLTELLAHAPSFRAQADRLRLAARFEEGMLFTGERGTGRETAARAVHALSDRRCAPFVRVRCSGQEARVQAELFGAVDGPGGIFHPGAWEEADGGTLFLEDVEALSPSLQEQVIRTVRSRALRRPGRRSMIPVNVRLMASSSGPLEEAVRTGKFRLDLCSSLSGFVVQLPPLRGRPEDLEALTTYFVGRAARALGLPQAPRIGAAFRRRVRSREWPGNADELRDAVTRSVRHSPRGLSDLLPAAGESVVSEPPKRIAAQETPASMPTFEEMQREYFAQLLEITGGRIAGPAGAAAAAGLRPSTLRSRLARLGFTRFAGS